MKTKQTIKEKVLNNFANFNQYSNWKEVKKDKQILQFTAKEFEFYTHELVDLTYEETKQDFLEFLNSLSDESCKMQKLGQGDSDFHDAKQCAFLDLKQKLRGEK